MITLDDLAQFSENTKGELSVSMVTGRKAYSLKLSNNIDSSFGCALYVPVQDVLPKETVDKLRILSGENPTTYVAFFPNDDNEEGLSFYEIEKAYGGGTVTEQRASRLVEEKLAHVERHKADRKAVESYKELLQKTISIPLATQKNLGSTQDAFSSQRLVEGKEELTQKDSFFNNAKKVRDSLFPLSHSVMYEAVSLKATEYAEQLEAEASYLSNPSDVFLREWKGEQREKYAEEAYKLSTSYFELGELTRDMARKLYGGYADALRSDSVKNPSKPNTTRRIRSLYQRVRGNILRDQ